MTVLRDSLRYVTLILLLNNFGYGFLGFGQVRSDNRRAQAAYEKAANQLRNHQYDLAIASLKSAVAVDTGFAAAYQQLGDIYRKQKQYEKAAAHYAQVVQLNPELTPLTWFGMGESLLLTGRYQEALPALQRYLKAPGLDDAGKQRTAKYIADCEFSLAARKHPSPFHPRNPGRAINSSYDEYFPRLTADEQHIIFTRKENDHENFYESTVDSSGQWQTASPLQGDINSEQYNEGAHCISPDGKYLFFTGCNRPDGLGSCDLYVSRRENNRWGTPYNLGAPINSSGWEAQPSLAADGRTLYFVSNRRGGQGGYDIWKSELQRDGQWGLPVNLGPTVNTPYDESSPYIHADSRTLYFASNGWPGFGDKDIFKTERDTNGTWQKPVNLGYPINDHQEQSALTVSMNGKQAFFSTRRADAVGGLDIYAFDLPQPMRPHPVAYLKGIVVDAESEAPIQANITVTDIQADHVMYNEQADYEDGTFLAPLLFGKTYALHIQQPGYLFFSENYPLDDRTRTDDAYEIRIALSPIKTGNSSTLHNIFFDVDRYELLPQSKSDLAHLVEFLHLNETVRIEIGGHTDNTGSEAHNQTLSENRAKAVHDYLIQAGIAASRLAYKGYGPSQPMATNDTEKGRQLNRRTNFKIVN